MTLEQLKILVAVVKARSFTRASERLGTQKSYVSRVVAQLEAELGIKLLERTTRTLSMTEVGKEVFERAMAILMAVDDTAQVAQSTHGVPKGELRLTCGVEFGMLAVGRWVEEYLTTYASVTATVEHTSRVMDLVHEGFDLAIRIGPIQESRLVARLLGELEYGLFVCPRYVQRHGLPTSPEQLRAHSLIMFASQRRRRAWQLSLPGHSESEAVKIEGPARLRVNNSFAVRDALLKSLGIGLLPMLVAGEAVASGLLVPVLPEWKAPSAQVHAVYPSNRYLAPKVRAFIDLALERFPKDSAEARHLVHHKSAQ
jgi:LysR family transcriptional regulator, regulator for bpeEF and oprC